MLFNCEEYLKDSKIIKNLSAISSILSIIIFTISGYFIITEDLKIIGLLFGLITGIFISLIITIYSDKIIQEMYYKVDIYKMLKKEKLDE